MPTQLRFPIHGKRAGRFHTLKVSAYILYTLYYIVNVYLFFSGIVGEYWADSPRSMLPIYRELIAADLRIWVFRYKHQSFFVHQTP